MAHTQRGATRRRETLESARLKTVTEIHHPHLHWLTFISIALNQGKIIFHSCNQALQCKAISIYLCQFS